jgi:hypothetical protein
MWGQNVHKGYNSSDLDDGEDKFSFTVGLDAEQINNEDGCEEDGYKDGFGDMFVPVSNSKSTGNDL